jgi:ribonuclease HII
VSGVFRIGIDENGLGARLGPLIVTGVMARLSDVPAAFFSRRLPKRIKKDLDDSKALVSHGDVDLAEAWARALVGPEARDPAALVGALALETEAELRAPCPGSVATQCWSTKRESFVADAATVSRVEGHLRALRARGIDVIAVRSSIVCTKRLNLDKERGLNRFISDLHAMERLSLAFRRMAKSDVEAVCGKVGSMTDYSRFFGPFGGHLHVVLEQRRARSAYKFPTFGTLSFVKDADAKDPLVMLASLVGKYVRELLMARVARFHEPRHDGTGPSGYHDPVTSAFVERTRISRGRRRVPEQCFERKGAVEAEPAGAFATEGA